MPYISKEDRFKYSNLNCEIIKLKEIKSKGELEYLIFLLMKKYMSTKEYRYSTLHDCVYAAQHASDEFRRRFLDKREDSALKNNGDV